ncbi:hypothetical protein Efla_001730 [Eimeria flavescens]
MHCSNLRTDCTHGNPLVGARAWQLEHRLHLARLKAVAANVDNSKPFMGTIEQQQKAPRKSYQIRSKEKMQAHENFKMLTTIAATMNRPCRVPPQPFAPQSLNISIRRREHWKILKENEQMLQRLERAEPMIATAAQYRLDFAEHERRLLLCSYTRRRIAAARAHAAAGRSVPKRGDKKRAEEEPPKRTDNELSHRIKQMSRRYKPGEAPHELASPASVSPPPSPSKSKNVAACKKQFDYRWKEFKCYPAARQMWAQPKVFLPADLPKPLVLAK